MSSRRYELKEETDHVFNNKPRENGFKICSLGLIVKLLWYIIFILSGMKRDDTPRFYGEFWKDLDKEK